jgi:hypothetical protein
MRRPVCRVCDGQHNRELHAAKLSVRRWLREHLQPAKVAKPLVKRSTLVGVGMPGVTSLKRPAGWRRKKR